MNTYDPQTQPSDFIDGFAAGAELSRQSAFMAWMRYSAWMLNGSGALDVIELRDEEEGKGFDNGVRLGRLYANKPEQPKAHDGRATQQDTERALDGRIPALCQLPALGGQTLAGAWPVLAAPYPHGPAFNL